MYFIWTLILLSACTWYLLCLLCCIYAMVLWLWWSCNIHHQDSVIVLLCSFKFSSTACFEFSDPSSRGLWHLRSLFYKWLENFLSIPAITIREWLVIFFSQWQWIHILYWLLYLYSSSIWYASCSTLFLHSKLERISETLVQTVMWVL